MERELTYLQEELRKERQRQIVIQYIERWNSSDKGVRLCVSKPDAEYYTKRAAKYFELRERYEQTPVIDYSERNNLFGRIRNIEQDFAELLSKKANVKRKLLK